MPILEHFSSFEVARKLTAFLRFEVGVTRGGLPSATRQLEIRTRELQQARERLKHQERQLERLREHSGAEEEANGSKRSSITPENLIWIFGTARVGSTWLALMMQELEGHTMWREPRVGFLFGHLYYDRSRPWQPESEHFILGRYRESWINSIRNFVLDAVGAAFPGLDRNGYLVIKEPNGSLGAPLLMDALPESRMILLVRDPRDVIASALDAGKGESWAARDAGRSVETLADTNPNKFVRQRAKRYLQYIGNAKEAYEAHKGRKSLIKYEDLRVNTLDVMKRLYTSLEIPFAEDYMVWAVEKHAWENIPEEKKGEGKFRRKATPGGWRKDLTPRQVEIVEEETAPLLKEFYGG